MKKFRKIYKEGRNNQLLIGNKEFRDAKPTKEDLIPIKEAPVKIEYSKLSPLCDLSPFC